VLAKRLSDIRSITAGDGTTLREILHPERDLAGIRYSLAHAALKPGESSLRHSLDSVEVYYFLDGAGVMHIGDQSLEVAEGTTVLIPRGAVQYLTNTGGSDLAFLCIVDPAWQASDEEVLE